jgi:hypothetical protein
MLWGHKLACPAIGLPQKGCPTTFCKFDTQINLTVARISGQTDRHTHTQNETTVKANAVFTDFIKVLCFLVYIMEFSQLHILHRDEW